jgi:hypothetical protein
MFSLVIYGNEFDGHQESGLFPEDYKYRFLAEGDSWMDRSAMFHTSLLQKLAPEMDKTHDDVLIINLAHFGDTMRRIGQFAHGEFHHWIATQFRWKFDAILLSAGGNDFIDAARDPDPGQGILRNLNGKPSPKLGRDCINYDAIELLTERYINPSFDLLYRQLQSSRHANIPCFLNCYDVPTPRNAPAFPNGHSWLYEAYTKNGIPRELWEDLTDCIFREIEVVVEGWSNNNSNVHVVPTREILIPADGQSVGDSNDWLNEIHPNGTGWEKLASVWKNSIFEVLD